MKTIACALTILLSCTLYFLPDGRTILCCLNAGVVTCY